MSLVPQQDNSPISPENSLRAKKRKLEDAFHSLDNAVQGPGPDRPSTPKRTHVSRSLYSTLAKYGIKSKDNKPESSASTLLRNSTAPELRESSKKTPHLSAILSRAATRTKSAFSFKFAPSSSPSLLPPGAEYRPSSLQSFLSRLETFKLSTYINKPPVLDAVAASRCGWTNDGKDRLVCGLCSASWVVSGREGMTRDAANALIEKQRHGLVDNHKSGCPWKTRQCDPSIYCIPLKSPSATVKDVKSNAIALDSVMEDIVVRHPLTPVQLNSLKKTVASYQLKTDDKDKPSTEDTMDVDQDSNVHASSSSTQDSESSGPSEASILASLFGWTPAPPSTVPPPSASSLESHLRRSSTTRSAMASVSSTPSRPISRAATPSRPVLRAPTPTRSASRAATPTLATPVRSRRSSFSSLSRVSPASDNVGASAPLFRLPSSILNKRENVTLHCHLCQRRIGLWAFTTSKDNTTEGANGSSSQDASDATPSSPIAKVEDGVESASTFVRTSRPVKPLPRRQFDLLKEHRSYCPYVVKSTVVPSLPSYDPTTNGNGVSSSDRSTNGHSRSLSSLSNPNAAMEGWRAILTVLLRHGLAQRQRSEYDVFGRATTNTGDQNEGEQVELDNVKAMVAGVKQRGGRDLLKYVKGLLG